MNYVFSIAVLFVSAVALAKEEAVVSSTNTEARQKFSVLGGKTAGTGANVLEASVGYPGAQVGFVHGVRHDVDLGGRLTVNGAYEGMAPMFATGFKAQGVMKLRLLERGALSLGLELAPGVFVYSTPFQTAGGVTVPVAMKMGIAASDKVGVGLAAETPFYVAFAPLRVGNGIVYPAGFYLPVLFGGGVEIAMLNNLLLTFDGRAGVTYITANNSGALTVQARAGVAWKI